MFDSPQKGLGFVEIIDGYALDHIPFLIQDIDQRLGFLFGTYIRTVTAGTIHGDGENLVIYKNEISDIGCLWAYQFDKLPGFVEEMNPLVVIVSNSQSSVFKDKQTAGTGKFGWALAFASDDFLQFAIEIEHKDTIVAGVSDIDQRTLVVDLGVGRHVQKVILTEVGK